MTPRFAIHASRAPGGGPPPHIHHVEDETFHMLEGSFTFQAGGQRINAKPGDLIHIPRGTVHSLKNEGTVRARAVIIISPAGPTGLLPFGNPAATGPSQCGASPRLR